MQALGGSQGEYLVTILGQKRLVGGDDMLAGFQSRQDPFARHVVTAGQLNDHIDLGILDHAERVGGDIVSFGLVRGQLIVGLGGDAGKFQADTQTGFVFLNFLLKDGDDASTYGTGTDESDVQHDNLCYW